VKAKKSFGQHFLVNTGVITKIVDCVEREFSADEKRKQVVEIGPGTGALTKELLKRGLDVVAIEYDSDMIEYLNAEFTQEIQEKRLSLHHLDASRMTEELKSLINLENAVLCGNLPYNRGASILISSFEELSCVKAFVFMLQKEVVDRFASEKDSKSYGVNSILFQCALKVRSVFKVSPGSFDPPPKVDSAVIAFRRREEPLLCPLKEKEIYSFVKKHLKEFFNYRRKKLAKFFGTYQSLMTDEERSCRAENISPERYVILLKEWKRLEEAQD